MLHAAYASALPGEPQPPPASLNSPDDERPGEFHSAGGGRNGVPAHVRHPHRRRQVPVRAPQLPPLAAPPREGEASARSAPVHALHVAREASRVGKQLRRGGRLPPRHVLALAHRRPIQLAVHAHAQQRHLRHKRGAREEGKRGAREEDKRGAYEGASEGARIGASEEHVLVREHARGQARHGGPSKGEKGEPGGVARFLRVPR